MNIRLLFIIWIATLIAGCTPKDENRIIMEAWHNGETLPVEIGKKYPPAPIAMTINKGYNILIDLSHQCLYNFMWRLPDKKDSAVYLHKRRSAVSLMKKVYHASVYRLIRSTRFTLLHGILILNTT